MSADTANAPASPTSAAPAPDWLTRVVAHLDAHADEPQPLARLAALAGVGPTRLQRAFTAALGVSPKAYQAARRLDGFKRALRAGDNEGRGRVLDATLVAGYGSTSRAHAVVDGALGMTPTAYRAGGAGERLAFVARETPLGWLMMAATGRGVCFVEFGPNAEALREKLAAEFPRARLEAARADEEQLRAWMDALAAHLAQGAPRPDLPLDLRGTAFQMRVWRFLLGLPAGRTVTYTDVAHGISAPQAVRAAASACGANRVAVLVPCHRVLRGDGGLGGYRWGVERKTALLAAERERNFELR